MTEDVIYGSPNGGVTKLLAGRGFDTHRCRGSLRAGCSIRRYPREETRLFTRKDGRWHLYMREVDFDYDATYIVEVAEISYCPFCGEPIYICPEKNRMDVKD